MPEGRRHRVRPGNTERVVTVSDVDIYRSAKLLVDEHGRDAIQIAGGKALEMHEAGDKASEAFWCRIMDAIQELGRTNKRADERQH